MPYKDTKSTQHILTYKQFSFWTIYCRKLQVWQNDRNLETRHTGAVISCFFLHKYFTHNLKKELQIWFTLGKRNTDLTKLRYFSGVFVGFLTGSQIDTGAIVF